MTPRTQSITLLDEAQDIDYSPPCRILEAPSPDNTVFRGVVIEREEDHV